MNTSVPTEILKCAPEQGVSVLPSGCAASPSQGHPQYSFSSGFSDNCRQKKNSTEFLLKPLDLKSDFTLTLGYLNPSLTPPPPQVYKGTVRVN